MILRKIPVQEGEQYYDYGVYCGKYEFIIKCDVCGKEFQHESRMKMYCSQRCSDIANIQNRKAYRAQTCKKVCEQCGEEFQATRIDSLYCSDACRQAAYRDRQKSEKPAEQTTLYAIKYNWNRDKLIKELKDNEIKCVIGYNYYSESQIRQFTQANIRYIVINELRVPFNFDSLLHKNEITQTGYDSKYKKHLQGLKLGILAIDKTERVAVLIEDTSSAYNKNNEKCYNTILPEFLKKKLGYREILHL